LAEKHGPPYKPFLKKKDFTQDESTA